MTFTLIVLYSNGNGNYQGKYSQENDNPVNRGFEVSILFMGSITNTYWFVLAARFWSFSFKLPKMSLTIFDNLMFIEKTVNFATFCHFKSQMMLVIYLDFQKLKLQEIAKKNVSRKELKKTFDP